MAKEEKATKEEIEKHIEFHKAMAEYQRKKNKESADKYFRENA